MAEYYGKLKDSAESGKPHRLRNAVIIIVTLIAVFFMIAVINGIFGDTQRRDETRDIIRENTELKEKVSELSDRITELEKEADGMKSALSEYELDAGKKIEKPEGDMSEENSSNSSGEAEQKNN